MADNASFLNGSVVNTIELAGGWCGWGLEGKRCGLFNGPGEASRIQMMYVVGMYMHGWICRILVAMGAKVGLKHGGGLWQGRRWDDSSYTYISH